LNSEKFKGVKEVKSELRKLKKKQEKRSSSLNRRRVPAKEVGGKRMVKET